ncbi:hypothetical protein J4E91_000560 [Alternaria rosae]|nr:hypothetical protein J4E91_000560 [Alternaria rosae]
MASSVPHKLHHIHLRGLIPYATAARLQEYLVSRFLASKPPLNASPPPPPHIITTEFTPVYTCGRREIGTVSPDQQTYLRANNRASFTEALRGGQTTFHGPGQLVAYPIIDLRTHKLTPRNYVCLLEKSVWTSPEDKIAAIGVHMRRNITSHGVGLNVNTDLWWFDRIVACGLEGKRTTSFERQGVEGLSVEEVGRTFVEDVGERMMGVDGVQRLGQEEVEALLESSRGG